jgi:sugar lactone lactonase YvrE
MTDLSDMPANATEWYDYTITSDSSGNLYVTAGANNMILKINSQNVVSILAGSGAPGLADGQGSAAQFNTILGMATDKSGNIWVCDGDNHAIRKVTPDGIVSTIAGNGTPGFVNGDSTAARFKYPAGIVVDKSGVLYVTELGNAAVRKLVYQ